MSTRRLRDTRYKMSKHKAQLSHKIMRKKKEDQKNKKSQKQGAKEDELFDAETEQEDNVAENQELAEKDDAESKHLELRMKEWDESSESESDNQSHSGSAGLKLKQNKYLFVPFACSVFIFHLIEIYLVKKVFDISMFQMGLL